MEYGEGCGEGGERGAIVVWEKKEAESVGEKNGVGRRKEARNK